MISSLLLYLIHFASALSKGIRFQSQFTVTPGTERIRATIEADGMIDSFEQAGASILSNACGPCIGQWKRESNGSRGEKNNIICSFNRNFAGRNDGNVNTHAFLASPEIVTAMALSGKMTFNPLKDTLIDSAGNPFRLSPPEGVEFPKNGFSDGREEFNCSFSEGPKDIELSIPASSSRIQNLPPWPANSASELRDMPLLIKVKGKCTTDHISPAGKWLKYKGHLENISQCTLIGAENAFTGKINSVLCALDGEYDSVPAVASKYKSAGLGWVVVGDHNYGEGSAREHAAMQIRYLGGRVVIARSFARIHESNLKKQGVLALRLKDVDDWSVFSDGCRVSVLSELSVGESVVLEVRKGCESVVVETDHSLSEEQIGWWQAGGSLNYARRQ